MARRDPTLPTPGVSTLPEADLVARVKAEADSNALVELVNRHTGIYFQVVHRYAAAYPNVIRAHDLDDDKLFNLYNFILAYQSDRGMKLCTYIGERTDYLCKTLLKRGARDPIMPGAYSSTGAAPLDVDDDTFSTTNGACVTLEDQSRASRVVENANTDLSMEDVRRAAGKVCADDRFARILDYRHAPACLSWREVGHKMGMSHEACRKIFNVNLALVKAHLTA